MNCPSELRHLFPPPGADVMRWRNTELREILSERDGGCWEEGCNGEGISDIHEAIRRGHVQGWQPEKRLVIFTGINSVKLCRAKHHNTALEPKLDVILDWMLEQYGPYVWEWANSLEFKSPPSRLRKWLNENKH